MDERMIRDAHGAPDLAELVLADARARGKSTHRGTAGDMAWAPTSESALTSAGHDPRSILILAIVVATLAMVIAWTASFGGDDGGPLEATRSTPKQDVARAASGATLPATPSADAGAAPAPIVGIDLQVGRVTTSVVAGQPVVRVGVRNAGTLPHGGGSGAQLLVLLDGERVGSTTIGAIAPNGAATVVDVPLYSCSSGAHSLVVVADVAGVVREADERNNAQALPTSLSC